MFVHVGTADILTSAIGDYAGNIVRKIADRYMSTSDDRVDSTHGEIGDEASQQSRLNRLEELGKHLNRFDSVTQSYQKSESANLGIFGNLFGGSIKNVEAGIIKETKRYLEEIITNDSGNKIPIQLGVSVRMLVATTTKDIQADLSIPNIAAMAQLGKLEAKIGISVIGFNGPLGDKMPSVSYLNVEKFDEYMNAFRVLESYVFGSDGIEYFSPVPIGYELSSP